MVHILGTLLPDSQFARYALTHFYGVGRATAHRLCARMQIHDRCRVRNLTPSQITSLTAFLSSPSSAPDAPSYAMAKPDFVVSRQNVSPLPVARPKRAALQESSSSTSNAKRGDPLKHLKIESELRREIRENIAHQRMIGSYVGRRHAIGLPVRGQRTQTNAKTAMKLNRIERYA